jgi:hypothetical protein
MEQEQKVSLLESWTRLKSWRRCGLISCLVAPSTVFLLGSWHEQERKKNENADN